jgi:hypothetical protein
MYQLIVVPQSFNKDIYSLSKEQAKEYFTWVRSIKSERIEVLEKNIKTMFPDWRPDYSKKSLIDLYSWFVQIISLELIGKAEIDKFKEQIAKTPQFINIIPVPKYVFTTETISICFDVSLYFGETMVKCVTDVKWSQKINSLNFIDYAYPLLVSKNSTVPVNPRRLVENLATDILHKESETKSFIELFDIWERIFAFSEF